MHCVKIIRRICVVSAVDVGFSICIVCNCASENLFIFNVYVNTQAVIHFVDHCAVAISLF